MSHEPPVASLRGDREHATDLLQRRRDAVFEEVHERLDGGQSRVPRARLIASRGLEMHQERRDQRDVELLEVEHRRWLAEPLTGEAKQELKRVRIAVAGMRACSAMYGQPLSKKRRHVWSEGSHGSSCSRPAQASAIRFIKKGVACRYQ